MVQLCALRSSGEATALEGSRAQMLSVTVSESAIREGVDAAALRTAIEHELARRELSVANHRSMSVVLIVDALDMTGPVATSTLQMSVDLFKMSVAMQFRGLAVAWVGHELGRASGNAFMDSSAAALKKLLDRYATYLKIGRAHV